MRRLLRTIRLRLRSLVFSDRVEDDLDAELRDHLEREIERHLQEGRSPADARAAALREFGNVALIQERCRDTRRVSWLEDLGRDLGYALRSMRRAPGYTAVAALSLALAIGANTAIFSLVNALILRDLRVANPHELFEVGRVTPFGRGNHSYPAFERFRDENTVFASLVAMQSGTVDAEIGEAVRPPIGRFVSGGFFAALGIVPALGRLLDAADDRPAGPEGATIVVISHGLWRRAFGGAPDVLGKTLTIDTHAFTIVGVVPPGFQGLIVGRPDDFYIPMGSEPRVRRQSWLGMREFGWLTIVGRLKPGVSQQAAQANLDLIFQRVLEEQASKTANEERQREIRTQWLVLDPARAGVSAPRREWGRPVLLLMGAVSLVLLIACANVVNLLLERGIARRREIGLRLAIGASRGRLVRQLMTESAALGIMGGAAGLCVAVWGTRVLAGFIADGDPTVAFDIAPDGRVLLFTAAISIGSALAAGVAPAVRAVRSTLTPGMQEGSRTLTTSRRAMLGARTLIATQVALSLVLLVGATLLVTSLRNLRTFDAGFAWTHVVKMGVNPVRGGYTGEARLAYFRQVLERVRATPGVAAAALSTMTPIGGGSVDLSFAVVGRPAAPGPTVYVNEVSDGYFATMTTPIVAGRDFGPDDRPATPRVAVVNEAVVRRYFSAENPIGQRVRVGRFEGLEVVGVVANAKYVSLREEDPPTVYLHALQRRDGGGLTLSARADGSAITRASEIRRAVVAVGATVPVTAATLLSTQIDRSLEKERLMTRLLTGFAIVAVVLAAIGLYGVLAYAVTRRTNEIGIRLALGAPRATVLWSVLRESWLLVAIGVAVGLPAALALTRLLASLLFGVTATNPWLLGGVVACLLVVALAAAARPAWRAVRIDPLVALRYE